MRLGVARDFWNEVDDEIASAVDSAVTALGKITAGVQEVELSTDTDRTLVRCEAYAYHQKYLPQQEQKLRSGNAKPYPQRRRRDRRAVHPGTA